MSTPYLGGEVTVPLTGDNPNLWEVELPYTRPPLTDNQRLHWAAKARLVGQLRKDTALLARHHKLPHDLAFARIDLHWQPRIRRRRDAMNLAATLKPCVDGLVDYGLVPDDDSEHVASACHVHPAGARARLWLTVEAR